MTDDRFETVHGFRFRLRKRGDVIDIAALDHVACWFTICRMSTFDSAIMYATKLADYWATGGSKPPLLNDRRMIDGAWHTWCGGGWIAERYSPYVRWPVQDQNK